MNVIIFTCIGLGFTPQFSTLDAGTEYDHVGDDSNLFDDVLVREIRESEPVWAIRPPPRRLVTELPPEKHDNKSYLVTEDFHLYYNSSVHVGGQKPSYWLDFDKISHGVTHILLSNSHRKASTISIDFKFPFYGHLLEKITIATGGFLYMGTYIHHWLAVTQYVAPFMANFDTRNSSFATVKYATNGTTLTVQWANLTLQDQPNTENFTFQATLKDNGDIIMSYMQVPLVPSNVSTMHHPVKVGISDAFIIQMRSRFQFLNITRKRNTIYEYHRINFKNVNITDNSYIYLTALPTCLHFDNCTSCIEANIGFNCKWCETTQRCSSGTDRKRQEWLNSRCLINAVIESCDNISAPTEPPANNGTSIAIVDKVSLKTTLAPSLSTTAVSSDKYPPYVDQTSTSPIETTFVPGTTEKSETKMNRTKLNRIDDGGNDKDGDSNINMTGIWVGVIILVLIMSIVAWVVYAYKNPHSSSGQLLIKYRPSQWKSPETSASYSVSSMHI